MPFSVNNLLNDANVVLQKEATNKFGTVVDDFTNKSVKAITEAVSTNTTQITEGPLDTRRFPTQVSPAGGQSATPPIYGSESTCVHMCPSMVQRPSGPPAPSSTP